MTHTCFFSIEWPRYSSVEVAKEKLLYAVTNCTDVRRPAALEQRIPWARLASDACRMRVRQINADATAEGRANMAMDMVEDD